MNTQSNLFTRERVGEDVLFSAPLGEVKNGQLEIANGISHVELTGDPSTRELFRAQFSGLIPDVRARNGRVHVHYRFSTVEWLLRGFLGGRHDGEISLNTSIPWQIDIRGGVSQLDADLRDLQLSSLMVMGGVSGASILLPRPVGTVQIHVASGVSNLRIFRPQAAPARLKVAGGISQLVFDEQSYGSIGGGMQLESPEYKAQTDRYDIVVSGGVSNLVVRTQA